MQSEHLKHFADSSWHGQQPELLFTVEVAGAVQRMQAAEFWLSGVKGTCICDA
jgi:hypothetical protein